MRFVRVFRPALVVASCAALAPAAGCDIVNEVFGCDYETDPGCEDPERAQVVGTVSVPETSGASLHTGDPALAGVRAALSDVVGPAARARRDAHERDWNARRRIPVQGHENDVARDKVPTEHWRAGEVIVRSHEPMRGRKAEWSTALSGYATDALGTTIHVDVRLCGTETRCLADVTDADGKKLDPEQTRLVVDTLATSSWLKYAERNLVLQRAAVFPDDEFFSFQWHYAAIDVPNAWDITQGEDSTTTAIIDTGILFDHPDLQGRIVGGADLIDDPDTANDGDGRDDDGNDAGDNACGGGCHSHHGSHVAGTIGAATDNGTMVAGINWRGGLLAVRVLGQGGGSLADIADGIEWAVGNSVDGVPNNARPADVLNMSLGGAGESQAMNDAIDDAVQAGAIVLVAAGNDDQDASGFTPANAPGAITIAAVGNGAGEAPEKASYSNFGAKVDVAGPGGEQAVDNDSDGNGDGVLSTVGDFVKFYQGTSMATPHVAGVAALMKSVNPNLTQEEVRQILKDTADADIVCDAGCGAGQINAFAAVQAARGGATSGLSASSARVGRGVTTATIVFRNFGDATVHVEFSVGGQDRDVVGINAESADIPAGGKTSVVANIQRADGGTDRGSATITAVGGSESAEARLEWTADTAGNTESIAVAPVRIDDDGSFEVISSRLVFLSALSGLDYKLWNLDAGTYLITGLIDGNGNDSFDDPEDGVGIYTPRVPESEACTAESCGRVTLQAGQTLASADFLVVPGFTGGDDVGGGGSAGLGDPCTASTDCGDGLYCEAAFADFGGYCTTDCNGGASECPAGSTCFDIGSTEPYQICFKDCASTADCARDGYVCASDGVCEPG